MLSRNRVSCSVLVPVIMMTWLFALSAAPAAAAPMTIAPGGVWSDSSGAPLQAHGHGIIKVGSTYFWIGEDKTNGSPFQNIKCYSSTDLKNWTFVGNLLTRQASGDLGPNRIIERPHVVFNAATSTYVMWMHIDNTNYSERRAGRATSSSVCGPYTYRGSLKPLNHDSLDDNLFVDGTTGYFLSEDRTNQQLQIYRLSPDFLNVEALVASLPQYESPAMVKIGNTYFLFGSHLTGWNTNDNQYTTATSIAGPWSAWRSFAPAGTNTCNSQVTNILPVQGTNGTTYMFMGDRWFPNNLAESRYIWEPLTISGTNVSISCHSSWALDAAAGTWGGGVFATYHRLTNRNSGKVVDVNGGSVSDGAQIIQWPVTGGANQQWEFQDAGGGYFRLVSRSSGKCLDVDGASTADGAGLIQWPCGAGTNQQFQWAAVGSFFRLIARHSAKCVNVTGSSTGDGALLEQRTCGTGNSFQWSRQ